MSESSRWDASGPIIVWFNHGYDGWQPRSYSTLKDALEGERYGEDFVITRLARYKVEEDE